MPEQTTEIAAPPLSMVQAQPTTENLNPFARRDHDSLAHGAVAIETGRAVAEAQGRLLIAQRFPRDEFKAMERALNACKREELAKAAFYSYPRGTQIVTGPSIRLAEEAARNWGNLDYGLRELSNQPGVSEMEAYAWDLETNTITKQQFTVRHLRDTKKGTDELTDQRDIYEITANMGARRLRARILAALPGDYVNAMIKQCKVTLATKGAAIPLPDRIRLQLNLFGQLGVTAAHVEQLIGKSLDKILPEDLVYLAGVYNAIKDGQAKPSDYFDAPAVNLTTEQPQPSAAPARRGPGRPPKPATTAPAAAETKPAEQAQAAPAAATAPATAPREATGPELPSDATEAADAKPADPLGDMFK